MTRKTIAIDIDDVLATSVQGFVEFSNQYWGTNLSIDDYNERWSEMWKVSHEEEVRRAGIIYRSGLVRRFGAVDDAFGVLKQLREKYKLVITTSRASQTKSDTLAWIDLHFPNIFSEVHLAGFYDELNEDSHMHTKAELCRSIGADYLVDDHPKHCFAAAEVGIPSLLFGEYSWSRNLGVLPKGVTRVTNWQEVRNFFDAKG